MVGPLILILKLTVEKSFLDVTDKIAVKIPNHSCILRLLKRHKRMIRTSANISRTNQFKNPKEFYENIQWLNVFLDGVITSDVESTIIEFEDSKLKIHEQVVLTHKEILKII